MTVRLYDSKTQALTDFAPIVPGEAGIYVCGPTVQSSPHIGHLRSALVYDQWRRWLGYRGFSELPVVLYAGLGLVFAAMMWTGHHEINDSTER